MLGLSKVALERLRCPRVSHFSRSLPTVAELGRRFEVCNAPAACAFVEREYASSRYTVNTSHYNSAETLCRPA